MSSPIVDQRQRYSVMLGLLWLDIQWLVVPASDIEALTSP